MRVTLSEIARLAGVSKATVSAVMNNKPNVSWKTKQKVLQLVRRFNYIPNDLARSLVSNQTGIIGLVVRDITNPFYSKVTIAVEEVANKNQYGLILCNSKDEYLKEKEQIYILKKKRVDGIIIFLLEDNPSLHHIFDLVKEKYPFVIVGHRVKGLDVDYINSDDESGAYEAVKYLISVGHRKIAHLIGPSGCAASLSRLRGYKRALHEAGIKVPQHFVITGGSNLNSGYHTAKSLLSLKNRPTAIFAYNDLVAVGVFKASRELGLRIPDDIAVVGFDDIELAEFLSVPLTTVRQPMYELGKKSAKLLFDRITQKENVSPIEITLKTSLVVRKSA